MPKIRWIEAETEQSIAWHSESGMPPPRRAVVADDRMRADVAYRLIRAGTALVWRGDFHNARQLLQALGRRADRGAPPTAAAFHHHRRARNRRAGVLNMLLVALDDDYGLALRRAPDVRPACAEAYGTPESARAVPLRELLGVIGAHEWRRRGVPVAALGARIHPHYGVFSPVRGEYVDLVAAAPLPPTVGPRLAFDLGTGTGVLAAVLARRGIERIVATDLNPRAVACARDNVDRLRLDRSVEVARADLYPPGGGRADLVVCNPPWIPARPTSPFEAGVYDENGRMLHGFLAGLADRLAPGGEGWLVLSDLAERWALRSRQELLAGFAAAGLRVVDRIDVRPHHPRTADRADPLHTTRSAEVTSLWRLAELRQGGR